ncbi:MAG: hypothetical protein VKL39_19850, partial [Leptolyngbyaceae bacterium]|nr:hypothetical protein [Leptolyngbyaceae bacterium]
MRSPQHWIIILSASLIGLIGVSPQEIRRASAQPIPDNTPNLPDDLPDIIDDTLPDRPSDFPDSAPDEIPDEPQP